MTTHTCPHCGGTDIPQKPLAYTVKENTASGQIMLFLDSMPGRQSATKIVSKIVKSFEFTAQNISMSLKFLSGQPVSGRDTTPVAYVTIENGIVKIKDEVILFR